MKTALFSILVALTSFSCNDKSTSSPNPDTSVGAESDKRTLVDLSHNFSSETIYWVTAEEFRLENVHRGQTPKGYYYSANNFSAAEHGGTHIDAPVHFSEEGQPVDEIPLESLIGKAIKIDVSAKALNHSDYLLSVEDLLNWEKIERTTIPSGSIVLLQTGFSKYYPDKMKYLGTNERGENAIKDLHFPGLSPAAAEWLVENRSIHAIGIDTPSIDYGQSEYFESHVTLLSQNIPVFENLTNLEKLPNRGFEVFALPMKIKGGSGAPLRMVAIIDDHR